MEINNHNVKLNPRWRRPIVVNILVFDLRVQLQHCTYERKTLLFALIKVIAFICKREILGCSSPLTSVRVYDLIWMMI